MTRPVSAGASIAVLLPLRLETRFDPGRLRVRVIPDGLWFASPNDRCSRSEAALVERFEAAMAAADGPEAQRAAFLDLARRVGGPRAAWLVRSRTRHALPLPGLSTPSVVDDAAQPVLPRITGFPDRLSILLGRAGRTPQPVLELEVDQDRLRTDPWPTTPRGAASAELRWWDDWDEAVAAGLAGTILLDGDPDDIDVLYVVGVSDAAPAGLFVAHRDAGALGVVAPGTPTTTVDGAPAADLAGAAETWWEILHTKPVEEHRRLAQLLTGEPELLGALPGSVEAHGHLEQAAVRSLWPGLWGSESDQAWATGAGTGPAADWAADSLAPEGPFPTLRVGNQPYGLLPVASLRSWRPDRSDPAMEERLRKPLIHLAERWAAAAIARGSLPEVGTDAEAILDRLADVPTSPGYLTRRVARLEAWWMARAMAGQPTDWHAVEAAWRERHALADELGLVAFRRDSTTHQTRPVTLPLVRPANLAEGETVESALRHLADLAGNRPDRLAESTTLSDLHERGRLDSVLLQLVLRSIQVAVGAVGQHQLGQTDVPAPDPVVRRAPTRLERWIRSTTPQALAGPTEPAARARAVIAAVRDLAAVPEDRLDALVRATLDTALFRLDPWLTALPARRLTTLTAASSTRRRLGAYGWVDRPRPGTPGPTAGGLLPAPSQRQAVTSALLRDRAVNDPEPDRWRLQLTSRTVRDADRLGEEVRAGAHLAEVVGRELERIIADPALVDDLRQRYPLHPEHDGTRPCDGLAALDDDLRHIVPQRAGPEVDALAAAVDAYGDLLVLEGLHHVSQGRAQAAGAAMDAAAGLARPPHLEGIRTHRDGRTVGTSVLLLLADVPEPIDPATDLARAEVSPARLADTAVAALLSTEVGAAHRWEWQVRTARGGLAKVSLADLGLEPADALALPLADLERLVVETADPDRSGAGSAAIDTELEDRGGSQHYHQAAALVALLGRDPAGPEAMLTDPHATPDPAATRAELRTRLDRLVTTAKTLIELLRAELKRASRTAVEPSEQVDRLLVAARRWGIAPTVDPGSDDPLRSQVERCLQRLAKRLEAVPADLEAASAHEVAEAIAALVSATGRIAVLSRQPAQMLDLQPAEDPALHLDDAWLPVLAPVRERLARLEAHQLAALTGTTRGGAFVPVCSRPKDPWQTDVSDPGRLVVGYLAPGLDSTSLRAGGRRVAVAQLDRFTEFVPAERQTTAAAFGFDAPGARAPQAILLVVPADPARALTSSELAEVVAHARRLARVRMARPAELDDQTRALLPSILLPATGASLVDLEP